MNRPLRPIYSDDTSIGGDVSRPLSFTTGTCNVIVLPNGLITKNLTVKEIDEDFLSKLGSIIEFCLQNPEDEATQRLLSAIPASSALADLVRAFDSDKLSATGRGAGQDFLPGRHPDRVSALGALPTTDELASKGQLYSQARERDPKLTIIDHLKSDVWWPWIEAGALARPDLLHRDREAYNALSRWDLRKGNDLKEALGGHTIPTRSEKARVGFTPELAREARRLASLAGRSPPSRR